MDLWIIFHTIQKKIPVRFYEVQGEEEEDEIQLQKDSEEDLNPLEPHTIDNRESVEDVDSK